MGKSVIPITRGDQDGFAVVSGWAKPRDRVELAIIPQFDYYLDNREAAAAVYQSVGAEVPEELRGERLPDAD